MPLSPPSPREPMHRREIECRGYRRVDGLWDIEAHLVDTKSHAFENHHRGRVEAGTPVHEMWLRVTVDDDLLIHDAEAASDHFPFRPCPEVTPRFAALKGLRIAPGWRRQLREHVGGVRGCTHLVELLGPLATTAYQTIFARREKRAAAEGPRRKPAILDSCHALRSDGEVVKRAWPEFYTGA
jgi:hypothetical protein